MASGIGAKFITPALTQTGWDEAEQIYREYTLRPGRVVVRGQKASRDKNSVLRADYVLFYKTSVFGGRAQYDAALRSLEQELYKPEP